LAQLHLRSPSTTDGDRGVRAAEADGVVPLVRRDVAASPATPLAATAAATTTPQRRVPRPLSAAEVVEARQELREESSERVAEAAELALRERRTFLAQVTKSARRNSDAARQAVA